jgi:hypothetical protein
MPQLVDKSAKPLIQCPISGADILSQLGETLRVSDLPHQSKTEPPSKRPQPPASPPARPEPPCHTADYDPERWEGLS